MKRPVLRWGVTALLLVCSCAETTSSDCSHSWRGPDRNYEPFPAELPVVKQLRAEAQEHVHKDDYAAAATTLEQARGHDPSNPQVLIHLAGAYGNLRRVDDALATIQEAERLYPHWNSCWYFFGLKLLNQSFHDEGIAYYRHLVEQFPEEAEAHGGLGNAYIRVKLWDKVLTEFQTALRLEPDTMEWYERLGGVYNQLEQYDEAVAAYTEAVRLAPEYSWVHDELARALLELKRYEHAAGEFREVLRLLPCDTDAKEGLAQALEGLGRTEEADALYREARAEYLEQKRRQVAESPESVRAHIVLGMVLLAEGRIKEADAAYSEALRLGPEDSSAYTHLADLRDQQGLTADARRLREQALPLLVAKLASEPRWVENTYGSLGHLHEQLGNHREALEAYKHATALDATYRYAWAGQGRALLALGRPVEAADAFQRALDLRVPGLGASYRVDLQAHIGLVRVAEVLGNHEEARLQGTQAWMMVAEHNLHKYQPFRELIAELSTVMPEPELTPTPAVPSSRHVRTSGVPSTVVLRQHLTRAASTTLRP